LVVKPVSIPTYCIKIKTPSKEPEIVTFFKETTPPGIVHLISHIPSKANEYGLFYCGNWLDEAKPILTYDFNIPEEYIEVKKMPKHMIDKILAAEEEEQFSDPKYEENDVPTAPTERPRGSSISNRRDTISDNKKDLKKDKIDDKDKKEDKKLKKEKEKEKEKEKRKSKTLRLSINSNNEISTSDKIDSSRDKEGHRVSVVKSAFTFLRSGNKDEEIQIDKKSPTLSIEVVKKVVSFLEENALNVEGLFRVSGNISVVQKIYEKFISPETIDFNKESVEFKKPHNIAGALMQLLRQDSVIPTNMYSVFLQSHSDDTEARFQNLKTAILQLPKERRLILYCLSNFLKKVTDNSEKNKMNAKNLGIVFGLSFIHGSNSISIETVQTHSAIVETLINYVDTIFFET